MRSEMRGWVTLNSVFMGLPIVRLAPMLDPVELISRFTEGRLRKFTQIVECAASEFNGQSENNRVIRSSH
jgi:hypothetical protein